MKGSRCKFCRSRNSHFRIVSVDKTYDEVACNKHTHELEDDADKILGSPGKIRNHTTSSGIVYRGDHEG